MNGPHLTRRMFLSALAATPLLRGLAVAQVQPASATLTARANRRKLMGADGANTDVWQLDGGGPLPVIRARQNQAFTLRCVNELKEDIWLHFHGVRGPAEMMTVLVPAGATNAIEVIFTPPDAGTFLIMPLLNASRQRDMGLFTLLIVEEAMPLDQFVDVPLIFDDWMISDAGVLDQNFGNLEAAIGEGRLGNWFTVNGEFKPRIAVDRSKHNRLRLANMANTRSFTLQFKNCDLNLLAVDGQPVAMRPVGLEPLTLHPGQRIDLLLVNPLEQVVVALDLFEDVVEIAFLMCSGNKIEDVGDNFTLPPNLLPVPAEGVDPRIIPIVLEGGARGGLKSAKVGGEELDLRAMLERGLAWAINGNAGPGGAMLFEVRKGETIILDVDNQTVFPQPLHLHGHVWKLLEDDGVVIDDAPWRDTAVVKGLARTKLVLVADNPGQWALQSLIAERSDAGLIGGFGVTDMP